MTNIKSYKEFTEEKLKEGWTIESIIASVLKDIDDLIDAFQDDYKNFIDVYKSHRKYINYLQEEQQKK